MEHITRQQVILIALLVAIMTAISTSVATVSLLDNSPGGAQQTIYKVIEKSIETVTNTPSAKEITPIAKTAPVATEISPSDIATNGAKSIVRIYEKVGNDKKFVALGIAVGKKDGVLTTAPTAEISSTSQYVATIADGREIPATLVKSGLSFGFASFTLNYEKTEKNKAPALEIKNSAALKLGSNVVALGGKEGSNVVSTGIVTEFASLEGASATSTDVIKTDMTLSTTLSGWLLFDTSGNLIGFETSVDLDKIAHYINGEVIRASIKELL